MSWIQWFNVALFLLAALVAFGALNKMKPGATKPCVILATVLILLGCVAQALGVIWKDWGHYADTALAGGICVLLLATQKVPSWWAERWANPLASVIGLIAFVIALVGLFASMPARAQERPTVRVDCEQLGRAVAAAATYRDTGASVDKFVAWMRRGSELAPAQLEVFAREIRRMWQEGHQGGEAGWAVYVRCQKQLGDMGRDS